MVAAGVMTAIVRPVLIQGLPGAAALDRVRHWLGWLAQLVEHFVYTEDVGGSSPSPPTMTFAFGFDGSPCVLQRGGLFLSISLPWS